ncbi:HET-domain-containing protein [Rhizodiscina lignyota]|uniref:HET-domain-containing protein n=1 Tax=Rhizodiscina lignyota TaxID=1504668 RepID=A0A9P4IA48_9PEZI|nr:HET-domain-containing protein [Rhizodiscina lignyota]
MGSYLRPGYHLFYSPDTVYTRRYSLIPSDIVEKSNSNVRPGNSTRSAASLQVIKTWLSTCQSEHSNCSVEADPTPWKPPTRLIEISCDKLKLCTSGNTGHPQYATLSHRWPGNFAELMRLTTENIDQFQEGIPEHDRGFSQVFRDAIFLCRELGIRYIWIDSLCIIQEGDHLYDWSQESQRMGHIYKNGLINFAATDSYADDPLSLGLFRDRDPTGLQPDEVVASFNGVLHGSLCDLPARLWRRSNNQSPRPGTYHVISGHMLTGNVFFSSLNSRGWVIQERLLSPRIVHFSHEQLFWECNTQIACEMYPQGLPDVMLSEIPPGKALLTNIRRIARDKTSVFLVPKDISDLLHNPYLGWHELVSSYSRGELTKYSDKLIAVSGVARMMRAAIPTDEYIAGLWHGDIIPGVLWKTHFYRKTAAIRPNPASEYQAPSWSWASVNCHVHYNDQPHAEEHDILVTIKDVQVEHQGDEFGAVRGGFIQLECTTYAVELEWIDVPGGDDLLRPRTFPYLCVGSQDFSKYWQDCVFPDDPYISAPGDDQTGRHRFDLRFLPVLKSKAGGSESWMQGLIIEPTGVNGDEYRRWGMFDAAGVDVGGPKFCALASSPGQNGVGPQKKGDIKIV